MKSVEWIILITENYDALQLFYSDILSLPVLRHIPDEQFTQYKLNNCFLAIYGKPFVEPMLGSAVTGRPGSAIYSLKESSDIDADYAHLVSRGVPFLQAPKTQAHGQRTAFFTDPDGNIWEIQQWIKR